MAGNAIESDFRSSKMAAGGHFVKNAMESDCCNLSGVPLGTDCTTVHLKCLGSIRYPLNGQPVDPSAIYPLFALGQIHQF